MDNLILRSKINRCFVGILARLNENGAVALFSSFWLFAEGHHFLVTAGHVVADADEQVTSLQDVTELGADLALVPEASAAWKQEIPFSFDVDTCLTGEMVSRCFREAYDDQPEDCSDQNKQDLKVLAEIFEATDCGLIPLNAMYVDNLRHLGASPVSLESGKKLEEFFRACVEDDIAVSYYLVGIPVTTLRANPRKRQVTWRIETVPLQPRKDHTSPPILAFEPSHNRPFDYKGFSGGPVFAVTDCECKLLAVDYAQHKGHQIIKTVALQHILQAALIAYQDD